MVPLANHPDRGSVERAPATTSYLARRFGQIALDAVLVALLGVVLVGSALAVGLLLARLGAALFPALLTATSCGLALTMALNWWWHVWLPSRRGGSTVAMRWLGLRVVGLDGEPPRLGQYHARWLLVVVDWLFFGLVGIVMIIATPRHQRVGDVVARTRVALTAP
ncbi:RDD family protein [Saccharopolyspora sp. MS10]|uniref:RDD family protein n=1 Tax=Saccharopolyspora sp. MS10 TaxID=3385973 RepID=UPI00399FB017